jgi:hypothetical protein
MPAREYRAVSRQSIETGDEDMTDSDEDGPTTRKTAAVGFGTVVVVGAIMVFFSGKTHHISKSLSADEFKQLDLDDTTIDAQYERARLAFEAQMSKRKSLPFTHISGRKNFMEDETKKEEEAPPPVDYADGSSLKKHVHPPIPPYACPRRKPFPPPPSLATQYNGIAWPEMCFEDVDETHVFIMGDYGGMTCGDRYSMGRDPNGWACRSDRGIYTRTADNTKDKFAGRHMISGTDDLAQQLVAQAMRMRAMEVRPRYALNGGDNFYYGGLDHKCGSPMNIIHPRTRVQFKYVFEKMYAGTDVPFFSVLGNHDYGGRHMDAAWDQQIAYTWAQNTTGRWILPGFYWKQRVNYPNGGFSVEYYMMDTNKGDAKPSGVDPKHNICGGMNSADADCSINGGMTRADCPAWFANLWMEEKLWLERNFQESTATYKLIVTHWPPNQFEGRWFADMHYKYRIDLFVGSHTHTEEIHMHDQRFRGMNWVIVGGGGGITSEHNPDDGPGGRDQYGFMDLSLSKSHMKLQAIDERGDLQHTALIYAVKYPPVLIDEAKSLQKKANQKRNYANGQAEKAAAAATAAEKATSDKAAADSSFAEKTAAEKKAEKALTDAKIASEKATEAQGTADTIAAEAASAEKEANSKAAEAESDAGKLAAEKTSADKAVEEAADPAAKAAAQSAAAEKASEATHAAKEAVRLQAAATKAAAASTKAKETAATKREALKAALKDVTAAEKALRAASSDRAAAARYVEKMEKAKKYADDKAAAAKAAADKAEADAVEAEANYKERAYVLEDTPIVAVEEEEEEDDYEEEETTN